ncbi:MAG: M28 family peptidase [Candidatus Nanoarchaeia archaeon]|nr:M28 family peptidase [Candidatus Nanoarchaeia archaeon]MDD5357904.1 M28 family peptidase [Candidatus Nanoarchaeia archaeon]MDD5588823.1 M28 family peptidase [Candidatus Nanoarchaeia archaeon]
MKKDNLQKGYEIKAKKYINKFCNVKPNRRTGSSGNREATKFFAETIKSFGYKIDTASFKCLDFKSGKSSLKCDKNNFDVYISSFSLGCNVTSELVTVSTIEELEKISFTGKILLMKGEICNEQLMPKNFIFYNPEHHKKIYQILEKKKPAAIITATEKRPESIGAVYPFPLIEDGDFDIPVVYCTESEGKKIALKTGKIFTLKAEGKRIPSTANNVIAKKGESSKKIVICAHIDAYNDTPGASDNASGTAVLLLLAEMIKDYKIKDQIEIIAFNGEDNYSVGGQMDYFKRYKKEFGKIVLSINIDDVGYKKGKTAYSFYGCDNKTQNEADDIFQKHKGIVKGGEWYQGDHMIFFQSKIPAIAITSDQTDYLMKHITHTQKDVPKIINMEKLVELSYALKNFIIAYGKLKEEGK